MLLAVCFEKTGRYNLAVKEFNSIIERTGEFLTPSNSRPDPDFQVKD
jgi:hypothetical protein